VAESTKTKGSVWDGAWSDSDAQSARGNQSSTRTEASLSTMDCATAQQWSQ